MTTLPSTSPSAGQLAVRCVVPALRGLSLREAKRRLTKAHCKLGTMSRVRSRQLAGRVAGTRPAATTRLATGAHVNVRVRVAAKRKRT